MLNPRLETLPAALFEKLREIGTPTLCSQRYKLGFRNVFMHGVRPLNPRSRLAGESESQSPLNWLRSSAGSVVGAWQA